MDIVYLVKNSQINEELTYSLRTLVNIPHDKVFIVGGCPYNINKTKIIHVPVAQKGTKYKNTTTSLETICRDPRLSEDFILMNDDFFILLPTEPPALNLCRGLIKDVYQEYSRKYGADGTSYITGMKMTMQFLQDIGVQNPLSYELHIPMVMAKNKVLRVFSLPGIRSVKVLHKRSVYGNLFLKDSKLVKDVKVRSSSDHIDINNRFMSSADETWRYMKPFIHSKFPEKSPYEF